MRVPGYFYVNDRLKSLIFEELQHACQRGGHGGFLPAVQQLANVAGLPGIVKVKWPSSCKQCTAVIHAGNDHHKATSVLQKSIALPDVHSGYGFAIGNVAAFDMADPEAIVSPGGVGFDINCGVRLIRTNLVGTPLRHCACSTEPMPCSYYTHPMAPIQQKCTDLAVAVD